MSSSRMVEPASAGRRWTRQVPQRQGVVVVKTMNPDPDAIEKGTRLARDCLLPRKKFSPSWQGVEYPCRFVVDASETPDDA
ncbi:hypothetical protein LGN30_33985 [Burkholderia seminalis]|uniref:hypothetical protein n=1 Tax=Burkholderia seminalis TaxID=488731 RepID=UPI00163AAEFA|nr:hypothetical protein [Burkholderia seminalis]MCA8428202.1 hypothetical protein [Burkholderia seminalis]